MTLSITAEYCYAESFMLTVTYAECHIETSYAEYRYAEYHHAECHYTQCRYAECRCASLSSTRK